MRSWLPYCDEYAGLILSLDHPLKAAKSYDRKLWIVEPVTPAAYPPV
jgi:hypothetical protein